jgi:hypothetical protein
MDNPQVSISVGQIVFVAAGALISGLLGFAVWYLRDIAGDFKALVERVQSHDTRIAVLEDWRKRHEDDHP